ncbi:MAG: hypothetical protein V7641_3916 [Blastocatellia bacterium]
MLEDRLRQIISKHLSGVADFKPYKKFKGVSDREGFIKLVGEDPAFAPFYLNNEKYVTARIGGNSVTSLHRKLGALYEETFKTLLAERLGVKADDLNFSVGLDVRGKEQKRSTDGLIRYDLLRPKDYKRISALRRQEASGMAFEVRSCYQIGDSKRIQADGHMALELQRLNIEPVMLIFCNSSLVSPVKRLSKSWSLYAGRDAFDAVTVITDFDLYRFLQDQAPMIQKFINRIFDKF